MVTSPSSALYSTTSDFDSTTDLPGDHARSHSDTGRGHAHAHTIARSTFEVATLHLGARQRSFEIRLGKHRVVAQVLMLPQQRMQLLRCTSAGTKLSGQAQSNICAHGHGRCKVPTRKKHNTGSMMLQAQASTRRLMRGDRTEPVERERVNSAPLLSFETLDQHCRDYSRSDVRIHPRMEAGTAGTAGQRIPVSGALSCHETERMPIAERMPAAANAAWTTALPRRAAPLSSPAPEVRESTDAHTISDDTIIIAI